MSRTETKPLTSAQLPKQESESIVLEDWMLLKIKLKREENEENDEARAERAVAGSQDGEDSRTYNSQR